MSELLSCPYCGHPRSRLMSRTEYRKNADGLTATVTEFDYLGNEMGERDIDMLDFRHVFYRRCNKCGATSRKVKTDWHVRTQDEADDFSPYSPYKLWPNGPNSEWAKPWREQANKEWNTRAERTCHNMSDFQDCDCFICSECGEAFETARLEYDDDLFYSLNDAVHEDYYDRCDCDLNYCPNCGAKVVE